MMYAITELAAMAGVTRQAIWYAQKVGRLPQVLDSSDPDVCAFLALHSVDHHDADEVVGTAPAPERVGILTEEELNSMSRAQLETYRVAVMAENLRIDNEKKRSKLIDVDLVREFLRVTEAEHDRWISDETHTMNKVIRDLTLAGESQEATLEALRSEMSSCLKAWKRTLADALHAFCEE